MRGSLRIQLKHHLLIGFVASYILVYFFDFSIYAGLIIFISSWLIDIDHYPWYSFEMKDWNPVHAIKWYLHSTPKWLALSPKEKGEFKKGVFVFHGIEFWIILLALSFFHIFFLWVLIGVMIHMVADWIDLRLRREMLYNKIFPIHIIRRNKNKKRLDKL